MTPARTVQRPGFSLVELLVVIGIMGLLAALAAAAFFRVGAGQRVSATEATVSKIASVLDKRRSAVIDAIKRETIPADIETFAGNDPDRAKVVWIYMRLKQDFPTTRAEATTDVNSPPQMSGVTTRLPHRKVFDALPTGPYPSQEHESAACLYLILTATGTSGMVTDLEGLQGQTMTFPVGSTQVSAFADAWGKPIAFSRLTYTAELDTPNYANTRNDSKDPYDPLGKLIKFSTPPSADWTLSKLNNFWSKIVPTPTTPPAPPAPIHLPSAVAPTTYPRTPTRNNAFAIVSGGPDELFGNPLIGDSGDAADNVVSYRLKAGHKGQ